VRQIATSVKLGADPADLALADPGAAHRDHQVNNPARADTLDVSLHHHRVQRHVDPPAGRQQGWEERPRPDLRDLHGQVPSSGSEELVAGAVALGRASLGALVHSRTDMAGRLRIDHSLKHPTEQPAHELPTVGGAEHLNHLEQGRIV